VSHSCVAQKKQHKVALFHDLDIRIWGLRPFHLRSDGRPSGKEQRNYCWDIGSRENIVSVYATSPHYPMPKGDVSCNNRKFCLVPVSQVNNRSTLCWGRSFGGKRLVGRPRSRWEDNVQKDALDVLHTRNWKSGCTR